MLNIRRLFPVLLLTLLFAGCQSLSPIKVFKDKDKQDTLTKYLHSYELTVRWGELSQIYTFLEPELAKKTKMQENLQGIRVTSYEAIKGPSSISDTQAMQIVRIRYIYRDRQIEKTILDQQLWSYNEDKREWRRANPIPKF